ncbi:MAG: sugar ABC transporter permease [Anaerolineae bacterium]|nr:sugar ABC transporter permease [Thermoflexales bacterium]MDW8395169.1 sugar ABC transporter permease [Anaerolineae bacterium]
MATVTIAERNERALAQPRRNVLRAFEESRAYPAALLTPILLFFVLLNVIPTLWLIGFSFYRYSLQSPDIPRPACVSGPCPTLLSIPTGIQVSLTQQLQIIIPAELPIGNYIRIFEDPALWGAFGRTFLFVVLAVVIEVVLGVALGFLFWGSSKMPGRRVALTLLFTPMVITPVASGLFWRLIYEPTFGVLNFLIRTFGGQPIDFLTNNQWAFPAVLFVDIWMWTPFMILMTLAALGSVPKAELEAAEVDRMSWRSKVRYVIWPHGKFILMLGILLRTIDAFKTTDLVFLMTNGGPGNITELVGLQLYRYAFASLNIGFSSALAVVLLIAAIAFTSIYLWVLNARRRVESR